MSATDPGSPDAPAFDPARRQPDRSGHVQVKDGRHNVWDTTGLDDTQQLMSYLHNPELSLEVDSPSPEAGEPGNPYNSMGGKAFGLRKPRDKS